MLIYTISNAPSQGGAELFRVTPPGILLALNDLLMLKTVLEFVDSMI